MIRLIYIKIIIMYVLAAVLTLVALMVFWWIFTYNSFISKRNKVKQCESSICVILKQRNDMIPNLVAAVKAYAKHEHKTLTEVIALRSKVMETVNPQEEIALGAKISAAIPSISALRESYPELKADTHFSQLQNSLEEMELQLQAVRRTYNAAVVDFNNAVEMFPSSIIAGVSKFVCFDMIDIPDTEKRNVDVSSLFN